MKSALHAIFLILLLPFAAMAFGVDINFVVMTKNKQAHQKATLEQFKKEVEILNRYFVTDTNEKIIDFRFKSGHFYNDIKTSKCDFIRLGDSQEPYDVKRVKQEYFSCNDIRVRDPKAINFYIIDSYSPKYGYDKYTTSRGGFNSGAQPFVLLDWMRLDHNNLSPEEHEMGHSFGLFHECHKGAKKDTHTNIMASSSGCAGSSGLRNLGFNKQQVKTIRRNYNIIKQNFNLDQYLPNEDKIYNDESSLKTYLNKRGTLYSHTEAADYQYGFSYDKFRIFYSLEGKNKIRNNVDADEDGVPESIENLMSQLVLSKYVLNNIFQLQDPLNYANSHFILNGAEFIDVKVRKIKSRAYTSNKKITSKFLVTKHNQLHQGPVISITINRNFSDKELVLFHEMVHVYQNAKTKLRNDWFSEGSSRWIENSLLGVSFEESTLPFDVASLNGLVKKGYSASNFWFQLGQFCQTEPNSDSSYEPFLGESGISNLINDTVFKNSEFYKLLLENLQKQSLVATKDRGLKNYLIWPGDEEKSIENNVYMLAALKQTVELACTLDNPEVSGFLRAIDQFVQNH